MNPIKPQKGRTLENAVSIEENVSEHQASNGRSLIGSQH